MNIRTINRMYQIYCNEFAKKFAKKQALSFDGWDTEYGLACFDDCFFFTLDEIRFDLNTKQPKGLIIKFIEDTIDFGGDGIYINYKSYTMGLRYEHLKK